jgi:hypothetical protein
VRPHSEDGKDYWLVKNSYGVNFGEKGFFKLERASPDSDSLFGTCGMLFESVFPTAGPGQSFLMTKCVKEGTSKSKSKKHGPITGSDQNRSEPVRACDWSMLFAFAFARNTETNFVIQDNTPCPVTL